MKGKLFVISAPSGAGKTSLVKALKAELPSLRASVSYTTRERRPAEVDGQDYHFVSVNQFKDMLAQSAFIEHAKVYDNYYGTAKHTVEEQLQQGIDVILEIDWQGAQQIKQQLPESISIFILPPSIAILQERLVGRGQDSAAIIERRMQTALNEISHYAEFDYLIVNDDFQQALFELQSIITTYRLKLKRQQQNLQPILLELLK